MAKTQPGIEGIEPGPMQVPAMDRPSIAFAWFLDAMMIETEDDTLGPPGSERLVLACQVCGDSICDIERSDTLRVLLNTALAHSCQT